MYRVCVGQKPSDDMGKEYVTFVEENLDKLRESITDEIFTLQLFEVLTSSCSSLPSERGAACATAAMTDA